MTPLLTATGTFFMDRADAFPQASAEQWAMADRFDPEAVSAEGDWRLRFRCFAVDSPATGLVVVDTGVGPVGSLAASWTPTGRLPDALRTASIAPADVTAVVLTHVHADHVGWAVVEEGTEMRPFFPEARYVLQVSELRWLSSSNPILMEALVAPLEKTGQLSLLDGQERLSPLVRVMPTPGHTPGHQSVLVDSGDDIVVITGDVLVNAIQLIFPDVAYVFESDPDRARSTRRNVLDIARSRGGRLATAHLTEPFVTIDER